MEISLILSVLILLAAPLLARLAGRVPFLRGGFDGFVLIIVLGLIAITLLPEALIHGGVIALAIAITGFIIPWAAELFFHKTEELTHRVILLIAAFALVIHAASDGAILAFADGSDDAYFVAFGILLHRFGVAVSVWWLLRPVLSSTGGYIVLFALAAMTFVGYFLALFAGEFYQIPLAGYWQAFAAGSLLHVVFHPISQGDLAHPQPGTLVSQRIGTAIGILFIAGLVVAHYHHHTPGPTEAISDIHGHHAVDILMAVGRLVAPLLLTMLVVAAGLARVNGTSWRDALQGLETAAPWSVVILLASTIIMLILPDLLPVPEKGTFLFALWGIAVAAALVHKGARAFFVPILPRWILHQHHHHHTH